MNREYSQRGAALILVLGLSSFLLVALLGFLVFARQETRVARQVRNSTTTDLVASLALEEAMAKLRAAWSEIEPTANGLQKGSVTAAPGLAEILRYDVPYNRGSETGASAFATGGSARPFFTDPFAANYGGRPANPRWIPLYSRRWFAPGTRFLAIGPNGAPASVANPDYNPATLFNINTTENPVRPGEFYLSGTPTQPPFPRREKDAAGKFPGPANAHEFALRTGEASPDRPVFVQWLPVLEDPSRPPGENNKMVGRYAYWVDVENTKIHVAASRRIWREQAAFAFVGDDDATALGTGSFFTQSDTNPAVQARRKLEAALRGAPASDAILAPLPSLAGATLRSLWLDWQGAKPPLAADTSVVDWDFFEALNPRRPDGTRVLVGDLVRALAEDPARGDGSKLLDAAGVFSMLDPALAQSKPVAAREAESALRRLIHTSLTTHGYEDERDPLGRPKIDLVKFLASHRNAAGAGGNPAMFRSSELWRRLADPEYHKAYDPAARSNGGRPRSFLQSLNRFAGDGRRDHNPNGEAAALQMLLNMVEYTLPPDTPPLIDEASGIVGMRSIPYVAELAIRARSALWLLPEADRNDLDKLLARDAAGNFSYTFDGRPLEYYLNHVLLDLAVALVNPDPFATRPFNGELVLRYNWHWRPESASLVDGPQTRPIAGLYAAIPSPGAEPGKVAVPGEAIHFDLGIWPTAAFRDARATTALRIEGWEIRSGGALWHKVPVRHPGAAAVRQFWEMAQPGVNVGNAFKEHAKTRSAVGWFAIPEKLPQSPQPIPRNRLEMMGWDEPLPPATDPAATARFRNFVDGLRHRAVFDSVACLDPALGHRTGHPGIVCEVDPKLRGHVYGTTGHPWRHRGSEGKSQGANNDDFAREIAAPERKTLDIPGSPTAQTQTVRMPTWTYRGISSSPLSLRAEVATGFVPKADEVEGIKGGSDPGGLLKNFGCLNLTRIPQAETEFKFDGDGEWLDDLAEAKFGKNRFKPGENADVETLETARHPEIKALKNKDDRKHLRDIFAGAPRGRMMTSVGEIGFVHSGLPGLPILLVEAHGMNENQLNSPKNGPPMRMLLDLFTPGAFTDPATGRPVARGTWESGAGPSNSPDSPRRGTWNVNSSIAHESYLTLREGSHGSTEELKKETDPAPLRARVIWAPGTDGWRRNSFGNEHFLNKKLADAQKKIAGEPMDRLAGPSTAMPRGWPSWVAVVGGDFSPSRAVGGGAWSFAQPGYNVFSAGQFTWAAGRGIAASAPYYRTAFARMGADDSLHSRLLTFGSDGRKELELDEATGQPKKVNDKDGFLRGRFTADDWMDFQRPAINPELTPPRSHSARFSIFPMRHKVSDIALDLNYGAELRFFKTALNPRNSSLPPVLKPDGKVDGDTSDGNHFPGAHHAAGLFRNAPVVLLANQASTSANAFTIHIVAQTLRDTGARRPGIANSGPGHSDPDDEILTQRWMRVVVERDPEGRWRILSKN